MSFGRSHGESVFGILSKTFSGKENGDKYSKERKSRKTYDSSMGPDRNFQQCIAAGS
jgi:hypothetical protein